jgi:hypothetical protein
MTPETLIEKGNEVSVAYRSEAGSLQCCESLGLSLRLAVQGRHGDKAGYCQWSRGERAIGCFDRCMVIHNFYSRQLSFRSFLKLKEQVRFQTLAKYS